MFPNKPLILLAENNANYRVSMAANLRFEGYEVIEAASPEEAAELLDRELPDLAILDLRLTDDQDDYDMSGHHAARVARRLGIQCIIVTAFPSSEAARASLRGAPGEPLAVDFVSKSYGPDALLDAVRAVLARTEALHAQQDLVVNAERGTVLLRGEPLKLSSYQYALLAYLYRNGDNACSRREILEAVYQERVSDDEANRDRRLDQLVSRLRQRIEDDPAQPRRLVMAPDRGYRLVLSPE